MNKNGRALGRREISKECENMIKRSIYMYVQTNWKCIINREIEEIEIDKGYTINK